MKVDRYTHLAIARGPTGAFGATKFVGGTLNKTAFEQAKSWFEDLGLTDTKYIILVPLADAVQYTATEKLTTVWTKDEA